MVVDLKNCTFKIKDGGTNFISVKIGEGNVSWTEKKARQYFLDRGKLDSVRNGDEEPMEVKFDFTFEYYQGNTSGTSTPSVADALKKVGGASGWTSTDSDACNPYAVDLEFKNDPTCGTNTNVIETLTFSDFRYEQLDYDAKSGLVSCSGKCNALTPTAVRS